ncbi:ArnT family glycosyltransferase [Lewinella sp. IMCC34191]|uniref:ArnT family glycosyltransferase n=1 Tax=Lewinella sp. IMCC34191 TaxID=2259172 RepID=UPI000E224515|nr:glycosyltransferase family 39 protein [Lewinella sp. IMCC34191]
MPGSKRLSYLVSGLATGVAILSAIYLPVEAWDEARRGVNAFEMLQRGDYLNYYYLGESDTFNTKPPLFLWFAAASFQLFGVHTFTLRLPSLLALAGLLLYYRHWLAERFGAHIALLTIGATVSVNGLIGYHVAINGDTDMLFVCLLTVACLAYYSFLVETQSSSLLIAVVAAGLAFLTKGVAVVLVVPGLLAFTLSRREYRRTMVSRRAAGRWLMALAMLAGLCLFLSFMGRESYPEGGPDSLLTAMFLRDGLQRLTDTAFEPVSQPWFVFQALDIRFGPVIYVLYASIPVLLWRFGGGGLARRLGRDPFTVYSLCLAASVLLLLQLSSNKHNWYVAPAIPFLAYLFATCVRGATGSVNAYRWLIVALVSVAIVQRGLTISSASSEPLPASVTERLRGADDLYIDAQMPQDDVFRLVEQIPVACRVGVLTAGLPETSEDCFLLDAWRGCIK